MKRIIELSENDYMALKEDGVQNHITLADTVIAHSVPYEERSQVEPEKIYLAKITFDKEQLQEIVDKAKAELLASIERPQGEYKTACNVLLSLEQIVRRSDGWEDSAVEAVHNAIQTAIKALEIVDDVNHKVYRNENCPQKHKCYDYQGYHCAGCSWEKKGGAE